MGRLKVPLIHREQAIAKALELIDRDGAAALTIRKLGTELGVNGASLYYHFSDKEEILDGVRRLILHEGRVGQLPTAAKTWTEYLAASITRYRLALLRHPNAIPLMIPTATRPFGLGLADKMAGKLLDDGVPMRFSYAIIDSAEILAYGSVLLNPKCLGAKARIGLPAKNELPNAREAVRTAPRSGDKLFELELEAFIEGWSTLVARARRAASEPS